jgi:hypothetical protein
MTSPAPPSGKVDVALLGKVEKRLQTEDVSWPVGYQSIKVMDVD